MKEEKNNKDKISGLKTDIFLAENKDKNEGSVNKEDEDKFQKNGDNINYNNLISYEPKSTYIEILKDDKKKSDLHFKIIVIGDSGVGKSCLSLRATQNIFKEDFISTIGFEFFSFNLQINDKIVKLQIWDTCGQEIYRSLISGFYRSTELAILVFSVSDRKSFEDLDIWLKQLKTHGTPDCKIFLIGNKVDLPNREVSSEEAINCKKENEFECYMETSAKAGANIKELFVNCALSLYKKYIDNIKNGKDEGIELDDYESEGFNLNGGVNEENECQC